jgi:hypothetical protein
VVFVALSLNVPVVFAALSLNVPVLFVALSLNVPVLFIALSLNVPVVFVALSLNVPVVFLSLSVAGALFGQRIVVVFLSLFVIRQNASSKDHVVVVLLTNPGKLNLIPHTILTHLVLLLVLLDV